MSACCPHPNCLVGTYLTAQDHPQQGFTGYPPGVYMQFFQACSSDKPCTRTEEFRVEVDGRRVEHTLPVGLVRDFPSESAAWREVECQGINQQINRAGFRGRTTFADLAHHYMQNELTEQADTVDPKAYTTIYIYRHILNDYLIPRWGKRAALSIEPLEIEKWLQSLRRERGG
jgi:hypothetical protein